MLALNQNHGSNRAALTPAEHGTANIAFALTQLHALYDATALYPSSVVEEFLRQLFEDLEIWLTCSSEVIQSSTVSGMYASISLAPNLMIPIWSLYHELFSHLEQCKFVYSTLSCTLAENKKCPLVDQQWLLSRVNALQNECTSLVAKVSRAAISVRERLREQAFLTQFETVVLGSSEERETEATIVRDLERLGRQSEIKKMCRDLRDSWTDGLEGIIRTKIT